MNKKGFTLVELLATIVIMALIMTMAFPSIQRLITNNDKQKYSSYEKSMQEYAKAYYEDSNQIINLNSLKEKGLTGIDSDCIGYVDANNNYKPYLKCSKYETNGFDNNKLN